MNAGKNKFKKTDDEDSICRKTETQSECCAVFGGYYMFCGGSIDLTAKPAVIALNQPSDTYRGVNFESPYALTVLKAGIYHIDAALSVRVLSSATVTLHLGINEVAQAHTSQTQSLNDFDLHTFFLSNFLKLTAGDRLTLLVSSAPEALVSMPMSGQSAYLTVQKIL